MVNKILQDITKTAKRDGKAISKSLKSERDSALGVFTPNIKGALNKLSKSKKKGKTKRKNKRR